MTAPRPGERRAYLDNLKLALTAAVIVAHAAMTYGALGSWVYEEPALSGPVELVAGAAIALGAMFGLGLFYLVAGALTPGPLTRRSSTAMLASRLVRLGLPLLVYVVIVWPLLRWLVSRATGAPALTTQFWGQFSPPAVWSLGSGPLWFVAVLLGLTVGWVLWRLVHPVRVGARPSHVEPRHLMAAGIAIALGSFVVRLVFPVDSAQFLDLHMWLWPQCVAMFTVGAIGAERGWWFEDLPRTIRQGCAAAAIVAVIGLGLMLPFGADQGAFGGGWHWEAMGLAIVEATLAVTVSVLALDWFRRRRDRHGSLTARLATSSYPAFVVQGPVLVGVALILRPLPLPGDIKFVSLAVAAVVGSYSIAFSYARGRSRLRRIPIDRKVPEREMQ